MSDRVGLRPVVEEDLDPLEAMLADPEAIGKFLWEGWRDPRFWRRGWEEDRLLGDKGVVMITVGGARAGFISWRPIEPGTIFQSWEIGISLWPEYRGKGHGTEAQRQIVRYLFLHTRAYRIQALTDSRNLAEQRCLEKAGFTREGVLRGYAFRTGAWHDEVVYSVLRPEVPLD